MLDNEEDCNCGLDTPKPELVCELELADATKFLNALNKKKGEFNAIQQKSTRVSDASKKKKLALQTIELQREIDTLQEGVQLAFQRFVKCEIQNPQVQSLNTELVEETLNNTWNTLVNTSPKWLSDNNQQKQSKRIKKKK